MRFLSIFSCPVLQSTCITTVRLLPSPPREDGSSCQGTVWCRTGCVGIKWMILTARWGQPLPMFAPSRWQCFTISSLFGLLAQTCAGLVETMVELPIRAEKVNWVIFSICNLVELKRRPICDESRSKHVLVVHCAKGRHHQLTIRAHHLGQLFLKQGVCVFKSWIISPTISSGQLYQPGHSPR